MGCALGGCSSLAARRWSYGFRLCEVELGVSGAWWLMFRGRSEELTGGVEGGAFGDLVNFRSSQ